LQYTMMPILKPILDFFRAEKTTYARRNRTIEIIALEQGIDINSIRDDTKATLKNDGRIEAITQLKKRFHATLSAAWRFADKLDN
jgi:hypothetical protein